MAEPGPAGRTSLRGADAGSLVVDEDLLVVSWSDAVARYSGLSPEDAVGRRLEQALPHVPGSWRVAFAEVLEDGAARVLPGSGPFAAGAARAVVTVYVTSVDGRPGLGLCVVDAGPDPAPPDEDEVPEIRRRLEELGMLEDPTFLRESLEDFLANARDLVGRLLGDLSRDAAARHAHRLAGSSLTIGAADLGRLASELESALTRGEDPAARLPDLRAEADRVFAYCERLRAG